MSLKTDIALCFSEVELLFLLINKLLLFCNPVWMGLKGFTVLLVICGNVLEFIGKFKGG